MDRRIVAMKAITADNFTKKHPIFEVYPLSGENIISNRRVSVYADTIKHKL